MPPAISVSGINLRYRSLVALDECSLEVGNGEIFGLLGSNGAGKSSIMKVISGQLRPLSGTIRIWGDDIALRPDVVKREIGIVPQDYAFAYDFTVEENLSLFARMYDFRGGELERRVEQQLTSFLLKDRRKVVAGNLSGGYKRLLNFALSTLHSPRILLLDEPTVGLDPDIRTTVWRIIRELQESGTTIVLTTHYLEEASYLCDTLAIINKGKILVTGGPSEIIETYGGDTSIFVELSGPALKVLREIGSLKGILSCSDQDRLLAVTCASRDVIGIMAGINTVIGRLGLSPRQTYVKEPTLDDAFKAVVGRELGVK